jgi:hypothetical protein
VPLREQVLTEVGAQEPGSTGHDGGGHRGRVSARPAGLRDPYEGFTAKNPC